ncbi:MAG TPA: hypothetical protein DCL54_11795 [Alphaproteobacteria bacterium]|nr:hypothetical protein [Alphaproteobacteria bacterium]HAJ47249.1 hypothetical protein [Alphaproteobacteria bacterium]
MSKLCLGAIVLAVMLSATTAQAKGRDCHAMATKALKFSDETKPDEFVVESIGSTCDQARVTIYVRTVESGWFPLLISEVSAFGGVVKNHGEMAKAIKEIADRIEPPQRANLESWEDLQKAGSQPEGNPWRGTPLIQAEYVRLFKQKPRFVIIPTDAARGKMVVWDDAIFGRPVDYVFYGD